MAKRCFAFGCSYTHYFVWPTWADFIGVNFKEFYNCGMTGASNFLMLRRFIEADRIFKFNSEDLVLIGITAFGRFSFLEEHNGKLSWHSRGGPDNWPLRYAPTQNRAEFEKLDFIRNKLWQKKWGIYETWLTVTNMKRILDLVGAKSKFVMALDNSHYLEKDPYNLSEHELSMTREIYSLVDIDQTLDEFKKDFPFYFEDQHPGPEAHLAYAKMVLPEFITDSSRQFYENIKTAFIEDNYELHLKNIDDVIMKTCPTRHDFHIFCYGGYH